MTSRPHSAYLMGPYTSTLVLPSIEAIARGPHVRITGDWCWIHPALSEVVRERPAI